MNNYKPMNRLFLVMVILYLGGVNLIYYFFYNYMESEYTLTAVCEFFAFLAPCVYATWKGLDAKEDLGLRYFNAEAIVPCIATGLLLVPLTTFISLISQLFVTNAGETLSESISSGSLGINFLFIAIVPGVIEETIFRGVFYQHYRKHGVLVGMLFTAGLFGFFHMNFNQFSYAVVISIFFTFLVEATGSVWASVLAHITINGFSVIQMALYEYEMTLVEEEDVLTTAASEDIGWTTYALYGVFAIICTYGAIRMIRRICNICDKHFTMEQLFFTEKVRRVTIPLILGLGICLAYMIWYEMAV